MTDLPLLAQIIFFSLIGGVFSLLGGFFLLWKSEFAQKISIHLITFAAGTLLGVALLDLLPEALEGWTGDNPATLFSWTLAGIVTFFMIERMILRLHVHDEAGQEVHQHYHGRANAPWLITLGDSLHNFVDGVAITAGFLASVPVGIVTALAVASHEIPQEISDFSIMLHGGWPKRRVAIYNIIAASMTTVGAIIAFMARDLLEPVLPPFLAFAAGIFLYIASSDLIPEIHSHNCKKPWHAIILLIVGILVVWGVARLIGE